MAKTKVSQETIKEIQQLGMKGALAKWNKGNNSQEFDEAIRRYYGKGKREGASSGGTAAESGPAPKMTRDSGEGTTAPNNPGRVGNPGLGSEASKAAATRRLSRREQAIEGQHGVGSSGFGAGKPTARSQAIQRVQRSSTPSTPARAVTNAPTGRLAALERARIAQGGAPSTPKKESKREAAIRRAQSR